ncbi:hypothetical protein WJX77_002466 [Trebouxia sp. C0004]
MARCSTFCAMPVLAPSSRYAPSEEGHQPRSSGELKNSIRCILHALEVLHKPGFAHTDLRVPFTPEGLARKARVDSWGKDNLTHDEEDMRMQAYVDWKPV